MEQVFSAFENGNASIEATVATPGEFHITTRLGAAHIIFYANTAELIDLRNKLTEFIHEFGE